MSKIQLATIDLAQLNSVTGGLRPDDGGNWSNSLNLGIAGEARVAGIAGEARAHLPNRPSK
jgi:hypothetical protein